MDQDTIAGILAAIGQPKRLEILKLVAPFSRGSSPTGLTAGEIAKVTGMPPATLSFHLKDMTYRGLLRPERKGRSIIYRADITVLATALEYVVTEICGITD